MHEICGFIILRKPDYNFDERGRGTFSSNVPKIGNMFYSGVDRMPWFDLNEYYYNSSLPSHLIKIRQELCNNNQDFNDFDLILDLQKAIQALEFSNKNGSINELAVFYSERMETSFGVIKLNIDISWLGIDPYIHGYGSLIREGIFKYPNEFSSYLEMLNSNGLFDLDSKRNDVIEYIKTYNNLSKNINLEPIDEFTNDIDLITIGRVPLKT